ncbi:Octanoyltransferase LipM [Acaryochloris thomasi RCC1774]|uniref:Octanoyltransferase LipM n=1 Tax=Acaryochloris thomasi RCC1774 TaxID=1764569 RepID=A0A2W1JCE6_9CYAN|nr:lipoate--protein ligase family protein [Acaryochloris thomasi]PZD71506.1 Octanoyltransferase LipM [Acaryochloris thomasi RCC1774]
MSQTWRLIPPFAAPGHLQMALDQWLFQQCAKGEHPAVLRFYTWSPAAISLGKNQQRWPQHWQKLTWNQQPVELVRRPSGGRAVLHQGDLTYMLVVNNQSGNRRQAYRALCEFLIQGWQTLGVSLHFGGAGRGYMEQPNCFAIATDADLVLTDGTKLIGSAQAWQGATVLQHGSIRLQPDSELYLQVFGEEANVGQPITAQHLPQSKIIQSLTQAAEDCFQMQLRNQPLSDLEWKAINASIDSSLAGS